MGASASRAAKVAALAAALRAAARSGDVAMAVAYLSGDTLQRRTGIGWATLRDAPSPAAAPALELRDVDAALEEAGRASGPGAAAGRSAVVRDLLGRATAAEQAFLRRLLAGELRQGAQEGVMVDAVARAAAIPRPDVARAVMLRGDLPAVAAVALGRGEAALREISLRVGRPVLPMLAQSAPDVGAALARTGPAAAEHKLDGARIQVHVAGSDVRVFSRTLDDVTGRLPEVVELARGLRLGAAVLDGEAIALRPDGRPEPFQVTASRFGSVREPERLRSRIPLTPVLFDLLHLDGADLLDAPAGERAGMLDSVVPEANRAPRRAVADAPAGEAALAEALAAGHEGLVLKALDAPYAAGRRGGAWVKVKPRHTLDLVVLAAEWGHGRRRGKLSNLHLGARAGAGFVMLGKTFKGLTDAMLDWQTHKLLALAVAREDHVVHVRPELVVEVAFDGVQASTRYPGGVTLRFARVLRHRPDKPAAQADTLEDVRAIGGRPPA